MVIASDFSGLAYLAVVVVIGCIVGGAAWVAAVWWGTSWLLRNRGQRIITGVLSIVPVLIAAGSFFGPGRVFGHGVTWWMQATWMLVVARVVALLIATPAPPADIGPVDAA